ncbi:MAG TPA: hypothetical protein VH500_22250 [Nitrososphaeraceae archaeon]
MTSSLLFYSHFFKDYLGLQNDCVVCKFSDEIVYDKLDISKVAVELHSVLEGSPDKI